MENVFGDLFSAIRNKKIRRVLAEKLVKEYYVNGDNREAAHDAFLAKTNAPHNDDEKAIEEYDKFARKHREVLRKYLPKADFLKGLKERHKLLPNFEIFKDATKEKLEELEHDAEKFAQKQKNEIDISERKQQKEIEKLKEAKERGDPGESLEIVVEKPGEAEDPQEKDTVPHAKKDKKIERTLGDNGKRAKKTDFDPERHGKEYVKWAQTQQDKERVGSLMAEYVKNPAKAYESRRHEMAKDREAANSKKELEAMKQRATADIPKERPAPPSEQPQQPIERPPATRVLQEVGGEVQKQPQVPESIQERLDFRTRGPLPDPGPGNVDELLDRAVQASRGQDPNIPEARQLAGDMRSKAYEAHIQKMNQLAERARVARQEISSALEKVRSTKLSSIRQQENQAVVTASQLDRETRELRDQLEALSIENQQLKSDLQSTSAELDVSHQREGQLQTERDSLSGQVEEKDREVGRIAVKLDQLQEKIRKSEETGQETRETLLQDYAKLSALFHEKEEEHKKEVESLKEKLNERKERIRMVGEDVQSALVEGADELYSKMKDAVKERKAQREKEFAQKVAKQMAENDKKFALDVGKFVEERDKEMELMEFAMRKPEPRLLDELARKKNEIEYLTQQLKGMQRENLTQAQFDAKVKEMEERIENRNKKVEELQIKIIEEEEKKKQELEKAIPEGLSELQKQLEEKEALLKFNTASHTVQVEKITELTKENEALKNKVKEIQSQIDEIQSKTK